MAELNVELSLNVYETITLSHIIVFIATCWLMYVVLFGFFFYYQTFKRRLSIMPDAAFPAACNIRVCVGRTPRESH